MSKSCEILKDSKPRVGNNVSHSNRKTKRRFMLNLQTTSLKSEALNKNFKFKISNRLIRTLYNKYSGSIDAFLLAVKSQKLTDTALKLKRQVKKISLKNSAA